MPREGGAARRLVNAYPSMRGGNITLLHVIVFIAIAWVLRNVLFHDYRSEEIKELKASGKTTEEISAYVPQSAKELRRQEQEKSKQQIEDMVADIAFLKSEVMELKQKIDSSSKKEKGGDSKDDEDEEAIDEHKERAPATDSFSVNKSEAVVPSSAAKTLKKEGPIMTSSTSTGSKTRETRKTLTQSTIGKGSKTVTKGTAGEKPTTSTMKTLAKSTTISSSNKKTTGLRSLTTGGTALSSKKTTSSLAKPSTATGLQKTKTTTNKGSLTKQTTKVKMSGNASQMTTVSSAAKRKTESAA